MERGEEGEGEAGDQKEKEKDDDGVDEEELEEWWRKRRKDEEIGDNDFDDNRDGNGDRED